MEERRISKPNSSSNARQCFPLRSPAEEVEERSLRDFEVLQRPVWTPTRRWAEAPEVVCSTFSYPTESKQPVQILPEYTPLRHRSAIERVIQAIENGDPKLDSAPKMWTESKFAAFSVPRGCGACKKDCRSKSLGKSMSTTRARALSNTKASRSTHSSTKRAPNARHSR